MTVTSRPMRIVDRLFALMGVRLVVWLLVGAALTPTLWKDPLGVTPHYDDHYFYAHDDAARITMVDYHQLPAWNPYYCGGIPLAANPQDESLAPDFLLRVAFGTGPGRRLAVLLFVVAGMEGLYRLAKKHGASAVGAAAGAVVFAGSGRFFFMLEFGWINMFGFELLPWVVLGYEEGKRRWRYAVLGGIALGWMLLAGGTYSVPYTLLVLGCLTLFDTLVELAGRRGDRPAGADGAHDAWWAPVRSAASVGAWAVAFGAAKVLPMLRVVQAHPRTIHDPQRVDAYQLLHTMLTSHLEKPQGLAAEGYVGPVVFGLAIAALLLRDRAASRFMTLAMVFFAFGMGEQGPWAPWSLARHLPLYGQLRNPERFSIVIAFFLALAVSRTLTRAEDLPSEIAESIAERVRAFFRLAPRLRLPVGARIVFALVGVAGAGALGGTAAYDVVSDARVHPVLFTQDPPLRHDDAFQQSRGNRWDAHVWAPASRGTLQCFEETEFPQSARLRADLPADEYALDARAATVTRTSWSPNRILLDVNASRAATIVVNQNWAAGWSSNVGRLKSLDGIVAIDVPAGRHALEIAYDDGLLDVGVCVSLITTLAAAAIFAFAARARWYALREALRRARR